jgi:hypothetical protein
MAKQGQHKHDGNDPRVSRGHNNPEKSTPITTGTPKKQETYEAQAREHLNTNPQPQDQRNEWHLHTPKNLSAADRESTHKRSGSDSDASTSSRGY